MLDEAADVDLLDFLARQMSTIDRNLKLVVGTDGRSHLRTCSMRAPASGNTGMNPSPLGNFGDLNSIRGNSHATEYTNLPSSTLTSRPCKACIFFLILDDNGLRPMNECREHGVRIGAHNQRCVPRWRWNRHAHLSSCNRRRIAGKCLFFIASVSGKGWEGQTWETGCGVRAADLLLKKNPKHLLIRSCYSCTLSGKAKTNKDFEFP